MPRILRLLLTLLLLPGLTAAAQARELKVVFAAYTPPYVFQESGNGRPGIVVEILQQALAEQGYTIAPVFLPIGRGFKLFAEKKVDATAIIKRSSGLEAHYSGYFMAYHNFAIGLAGRPFDIHGVDDLKGHSVIAFQNASRYLGEAFGAAMAENPRYVEMGDQEKQVHMLLMGRTDLAVMDRSIFEYYRAKLISEGLVPPELEVRFYDLFEPSRYRTAFVDPQVRDHFEEGLRRLRESGAYQAIYDKYTRDYFVYSPP